MILEIISQNHEKCDNKNFVEQHMLCGMHPNNDNNRRVKGSECQSFKYPQEPRP